MQIEDKSIIEIKEKEIREKIENFLKECRIDFVNKKNEIRIKGILEYTNLDLIPAIVLRLCEYSHLTIEKHLEQTRIIYERNWGNKALKEITVERINIPYDRPHIEYRYGELVLYF